MKRLLLLPFLLLNALAGTQAQTTGSFDTSIAFMGGSRAVSLYVPPTYNPANPYRLMVCLHGLGDTVTNYRNAIIGSLAWGTNIPNTIFVFPEASTRFADYHEPAGAEAIIPATIAMARAKYNIDTQNIILQGFSLGGRAALRYGLNHPDDFKGLLLNTPAVQGVKEAVNGRTGVYTFNYANASRIPIYMTLGATDIAYGSPLDSTYEQLVLNDGITHFEVFPGLGHTIPAFAQISDFLNFFNNPSVAGLDVDAVKVYPPSWVCNSANATPSLMFRNTGAATVTSVKYSYTLSGVTKRGLWTGTLLPYQHAIVPLNITNAMPGTNVLTASIDTLNSTVPDPIAANNAEGLSFFLPVAPVAAINEGFEGNVFPPVGWSLEKGGDFYTAWDVDNSIAKTGSQSATNFNTILIFDNAGRSEGLISPPVNVDALSSPVLSFDVSYLYHRYTPPYVTSNLDFADTLEVWVSNNCGSTYTRLYKKGGAQLATFANPIVNPLDLNDLFADPADSNWRRETIALNTFPTNGNPVIIKFNYISSLGGAINIDNVYVGSNASVAGPANAERSRIYPNPATDYVSILAGTAAIQRVSLSDMSGRVLLTQVPAAGSGELRIDTRSLPAGIYTIAIVSDKGLQTEKLSVQR